MKNDPQQTHAASLGNEGNREIESEMAKSNDDALIQEMSALRADMNAIEEEIGRLEIALQKWESNHRWQLEDIRKELKTISLAANLCALSALFYVISAGWERWG